MADMESSKEQQHPLWNSDRQTLNSLLGGEPSDFNLAECARLRIRYNGFPGARDIQADLDKVLTQWKLTEEELFARTRAIHQSTRLYKGRSKKEDEDWS